MRVFPWAQHRRRRYSTTYHRGNRHVSRAEGRRERTSFFFKYCRHLLIYKGFIIMRCAESAMIVPVDAHVGVRMTLKGRRISFYIVVIWQGQHSKIPRFERFSSVRGRTATHTCFAAEPPFLPPKCEFTAGCKGRYLSAKTSPVICFIINRCRHRSSNGTNNRTNVL